MNLKVVKETELPSAQASASPSEKPAEPKSAALSDPSRLSVALMVLNEIRLLLSARAGAMLALLGAATLTYLALEKGTGIALATSAVFDVFVFLPSAYIAFLKRKE